MLVNFWEIENEYVLIGFLNFSGYILCLHVYLIFFMAVVHFSFSFKKAFQLKYFICK